MRLKKLSLLNFKNIAQEEFALCEGINCLVGGNGAGKTNIVDAVYYLSMCKSSLQMTDGQSIRHGADFFMVEGQYRSDDEKNEVISCSYVRRSGKVLKRNGKEYERLADHVGLIPAVIVSPADSQLISDTAEERRRYLNACISQLDRTYLNAVIRYNAVLTERNRLLKTHPDEVMLSIYDMQLAEHGRLIHERRKAFVSRMIPLVTEFYRTLSNDREQVELVYKSELNDRPFEEILESSRPKDLVNEFTTSGIHRDDLVLKIGGYPLRKYGSQGQQKSFLIALKLAQYAIVAEERHERPILLLDDLFDKLDISRVEQLIHLVKGEAFGQIFITDCNTTRLRSILDKTEDEYTLFTIGDGRIVSAPTATNEADTTAESCSSTKETPASDGKPIPETPSECEASCDQSQTSTEEGSQTSPNATRESSVIEDESKVFNDANALEDTLADESTEEVIPEPF